MRGNQVFRGEFLSEWRRGHFHVRARQLTSSAYGRIKKKCLFFFRQFYGNCLLLKSVHHCARLSLVLQWLLLICLLIQLFIIILIFIYGTPGLDRLCCFVIFCHVEKWRKTKGGLNDNERLVMPYVISVNLNDIGSPFGRIYGAGVRQKVNKLIDWRNSNCDRKL